MMKVETVKYKIILSLTPASYFLHYITFIMFYIFSNCCSKILFLWSCALSTKLRENDQEFKKPKYHWWTTRTVIQGLEGMRLVASIDLIYSIIYSIYSILGLWWRPSPVAQKLSWCLLIWWFVDLIVKKSHNISSGV